MTSINWGGNDGAVAQSITEALVYDVAGNISSITREAGGFSFDYDQVDQLTSLNGPNALGSLVVNRSWSFDGVGNRTNDSVLGASSSVNNLITQLGSHSHQRDADGWGSLVRISGPPNSVGDSRFTYRADGKLTQVMKSIGTDSSQVNSTENIVRDALGRRVAQQIVQNGATITQAYTKHLRLITKVLSRRGNGSIDLNIDGQGIDEHLAQVNASGVKVYATDHLGSVLNTDTAGDAKAFGPYGERLATAALTIDQHSDAMNYGWAGRPMDRITGQHEHFHRMSDPWSGTFTTPDPLGFVAGDENLTRIVHGRVLFLKDPYGLQEGGFPPGSEVFFGGLSENWPTVVNQVTNAGLAYGTAGLVVLGAAASPELYSLCLANPAACSKAGISFGGGVLQGVGGGDLPPNPTTTIPYWLLGKVSKILTQEAKNDCSKK